MSIRASRAPVRWPTFTCRFAPASDIAFLGGIIRYIIENERYFKEYVVNYTNAAGHHQRGFPDTEDLDGLFSGWDEKTGQYEPAPGCMKTWIRNPLAELAIEARRQAIQRNPIQAEKTDPTLQHPRCVFQILKRHFARYTPEMVEEPCGIPQHLVLKVAEALCRNSGREQNRRVRVTRWAGRSIRSACNTSARPRSFSCCWATWGGRAAASSRCADTRPSRAPPISQRSTTCCPAICRCRKRSTTKIFRTWMQLNTSPSGWWGEFPKYAVSLLKAWYGEAATKENDWCYDYLPTLTGDHSHMNTVVDMADGARERLFRDGREPGGRVDERAAAAQRVCGRSIGWWSAISS